MVKVLGLRCTLLRIQVNSREKPSQACGKDAPIQPEPLSKRAGENDTAPPMAPESLVATAKHV